MNFVRAFLLLLPAGVAGQTGKPVNGPSPEGRWLLTADLPEGKFILPVEIIRESGDRIAAGALATGVKFAGATLSNQKLVLRGTSSYGPLTIRAVIQGSHLDGDWRAGSLNGHVTGERQRADSSPESRARVFEEVCQGIDQRYYDPAFAGVDWQALQEKYRARGSSAKSDLELFETINSMLAELKSSHLSFVLGPAVASVDGSAESAQEVSKLLTWRTVSGKTGYMKIARFQEGSEFLRLIDQAFKDLDSLPGLIIDLRGDGGGTLSAAMRVGDHLIEQPRPVGYFATRSGLDRRNVKSMNDLDPAKLPSYDGYDVEGFYAALRREGVVQLVTGGRTNPVYRGKVAVLLNRGTASAAEAFAAVLQEMHLAVVLGPRPSAGKMLSATQLKLSSGWVLTLPEADFRTPGGLRLEGRGVVPDRLVKPAAGNRDVPLLEAVKLLEQPQPKN